MQEKKSKIMSLVIYQEGAQHSNIYPPEKYIKHKRIDKQYITSNMNICHTKKLALRV